MERDKHLSHKIYSAGCFRLHAQDTGRLINAAELQYVKTSEFTTCLLLHYYSAFCT
jgi:hypothetical protein